MQHVQVLALVLVDTFDLDIEQPRRIELETMCVSLIILGKTRHLLACFTACQGSRNDGLVDQRLEFPSSPR